MLTRYDVPTLSDGEPDPSTRENRLALTRRLLIGAIRRYDDALAFNREVHETNPHLPAARGVEAFDEAETAERMAWRYLIHDADDDFDTAEMALASRIQNLFACLTPDGAGADGSAHDWIFTERAVRFGGRVYVLNYDVGNYEAETNIISVCRDSQVLDLDPKADVDSKPSLARMLYEAYGVFRAARDGALKAARDRE